MAARPNVLLLTVDALRADRTSLLGYGRPTTPTLERLAADAIVGRQAYSLGSFTQTSMVQILTATRPLSYGGYDLGAIGRPATAFKHFHDHGYWTACLSTLHWVNRFFGYGDGIDEEYQLFGLLTLPGVALATMRAALRGYEAGRIDKDILLRTVDPVLVKLFDDAAEYCRLWRAREPELRAEFPDSAIVNAGYDMAKVTAILDRHRDAYRADRLGYVEAQLLPTPGHDDWMGRWLPRDWYMARRYSKLAAETAFRAGNALVKCVDRDLARARAERFKIYPDARSLADKVIALIERRDRDRPFFIWTHLMDTHAPYVSGGGRRWYRETPRYLRALGHDTRYPPAVTFDSKPKRREDEAAFSALYDAAVLFSDEEIGRIVAALDRLKLRDDTIVAVVGDHGEELGEHGDWGHFFQLYELSTRVPLLIHRPGLGRRVVDGFSTILDVLPTVAAMAGLPPVSGWDGRDLIADGGRDSLLMESFYAGNCMFNHRPLYFAVRTADHHYIWREYIDPADKISTTAIELFDVGDDPELKRNVYGPGHPRVPGFNALIAERMATLPEVADERIVAAFGAVGADAVERLRTRPTAAAGRT